MRLVEKIFLLKRFTKPGSEFKKTLCGFIIIPSLTISSFAIAADENGNPSRAEQSIESTTKPSTSKNTNSPDWMIEEVIVTAQKRDTAVQDTAIAISAFSGADMDAAGIVNVEDLAFVIPNFHFGRTLGYIGGITLRGVSSAGGDRSTAFHLDGVYQNSMRALDGLTFFDLERVEVLRGPQGTLYGRNATGGAMNVITNKPNEELGGMADIQFGSYDQVRARAVINVPLAEQKLFTRLSLVREERQGYQENLTANDSDADADDADEKAARAQILYIPNDDVQLIVRGRWGQQRGIGPAFKVVGEFPDEIYLNPEAPPLNLYHDNDVSENPQNIREIRTDFISQGYKDMRSFSSQLDWELGDIPLFGESRLTAITSYTKTSDRITTDADYSDIPLLVVSADFQNTSYVSELQLASTNSEALEWVLGVFYLSSDSDQDDFGRSYPFSNSPPQPGEIELTTQQKTQNRDKSAALFGQLSFSLQEDLRLTLGLRYSHDEKSADFVNTPVYLLPTDTTPIIPGTNTQSDDKWNEVTGKSVLEWHLQEDNMIYFSLSRGYKAGFAQTAPEVDGKTGQFTGQALPNAEPEYIMAYEVGSKNHFLDHRVQANFAAFYYDYQDLQITQLAENYQVVQNAAEATIWGLEAEFTALPTEGLTLVANFAYLDASLDEFIGFREEDRFRTLVDFSGNDLPLAPSYTATFSIDYQWQLGSWGTLGPRLQVYVTDDLFHRAANDDSDRQDSYTKSDFHLNWRSVDERWSAEAFLDNISDEDVIQSQVVGLSLTGWPITTLLDAPRTFGLRIGYRWGN